MTKPLTYVETTIPSFYHEARTARTSRYAESGLAGGGTVRERYELVTSPAVLDELAGGIPEHSAI